MCNCTRRRSIICSTVCHWLAASFRWPGLGKRLVDSILTRDYQVAQGLTILLAGVVVMATLVSSFLYRAADPRVRDE